MIEVRTEVFSGGVRLDALFRMPDQATYDRPLGGVVHAPGWMSRGGAGHYQRYHRALTAAGLAVLIFDYSGVQRTADGTTHISLWDHLRDLRAALAGVRTLLERDSAARVCVMGSGGTGGALALWAAAFDEDVSAVAAISPYADGRDWLRSARTAEEWDDFTHHLESNRRRMSQGHADKQVDPIDDIIKRAVVRTATAFKADIAHELPLSIGLSAVDSIIELNPVDIIHRIAPRPVHLFAANSDSPVPYRHAQTLYDHAAAPKVLWTLHETDGYRLHETHGDLVAARLASWFRRQIGLEDQDAAGDQLRPPPPFTAIEDEMT